MKARVTANVFKNKATGTYHEKGEVIELSDARFKDVSAKGLVEAVAKRKKADEAEDSADDTTEPGSDDEADPASTRPAHQYEGLAYIETPIKVQPQAKEQR